MDDSDTHVMVWQTGPWAEDPEDGHIVMVPAMWRDLLIEDDDQKIVNGTHIPESDWTWLTEDDNLEDYVGVKS